MLLFEAFFKFTNLGILLVLVILILRSGHNTLQTKLSLLISISLACMLLTTGHESLRLNGASILPLRLFDVISKVCIWLLGLSMFNDNFRVRRIHWVVVIAYVIPLVIARLNYIGVAFTEIDDQSIKVIIMVYVVSNIAMMTHLSWAVLKGRNEDLVESRRKARVNLIIAVVLLTLLIIVIEQFSIFKNWEPGFNLVLYISYVFMLPITIGCAVWLTRFDHDALKFHKAVVDKTDKTRLDPKDQIAFDKLIDTIEVKRGFAEHGLTINSLAEKLSLPAHHLRPLINNTLGYSNFSEFLNHYRIEEVKRGLSNPDLARTPILTLALGAGFSTLSTFNRAFKMEVGLTPSDFRNTALKNSNTPD